MGGLTEGLALGAVGATDLGGAAGLTEGLTLGVVGATDFGGAIGFAGGLIFAPGEGATDFGGDAGVLVIGAGFVGVLGAGESMPALGVAGVLGVLVGPAKVP